jgi:hypothetical protein
MTVPSATFGRVPLLTVALVLCAAPTHAADNLVGHRLSIMRFNRASGQGVSYRIVSKHGTNGSPATFPLPLGPGGSVAVQEGSTAFTDPLTAGTWTGFGQPAGSKGWKYRNKNAPSTGPVSLLLITKKTIKLVTKATGTLPAPSAPNGNVQTVISLNGQRYCAEAAAPHFKEVDEVLIQSKDQMPPAGCACIFGADSDGDRLDNCIETDTGAFVSPTDTGTDPLLADTDGDGINDGDEVLGTLPGLDLPALGTSPVHKDILLEYDWFDDSLDCASHSHEPTDAALAMVTATFAAAPVTNPDGTTGINFIHDRGQGGAFTGGNLIVDANGVLVGGVGGVEYLGYKSSHFAANRGGYFHYVILPHRYNTSSNSSGQAEIFGDDMIVSLYCAGSDSNVAHTIVHELGHNLNLRHGGNHNCNYKPNYNSVMNYRYQFPGVDTNCTPPGNGLLDYSIGDRIDLDENNLDESMGMCGAPPWDWNGNTIIESGVVFDINSDEPTPNLSCGGTLTTLRDYDDWGHILFGGLGDADGRAVTPSEIVDCDNPAPPNAP